MHLDYWRGDAPSAPLSSNLDVAAQVSLFDRDENIKISESSENAKNEISDISVAIAGKMVQREIKAEDHEALISQFIENVGEA